MVKLPPLLIVFGLLVIGVLPTASWAKECVIVLHGMGRTSGSMEKIEDNLLAAGYRVWNESYASTSDTVNQLAESAIGAGLNYCHQQSAKKIHLVSHSLGGILIRVYLQDHPIKKLGRIVMLAPPNHGSEITDLLKDYALYNFAMGPAGQALGTSPDSLPNQLKPIPGEVGVIAGNSTSDPWFSPLIPGEDDGKVSVKSARLAEMKDFLVVDAGHTFIMRDEAVINEIIHFLAHGVFRRGST